MRYEYKCQECKKTFEIERSINDQEGRVTCPKCESKKTKRVYSPINIGGKSARSKPSKNCPTGTCPYA